MPFRSFKIKDTINIFSVNVFSIIEIIRVLTKKAHREHLESVVMISAFLVSLGIKVMQYILRLKAH